MAACSAAVAPIEADSDASLRSYLEPFDFTAEIDRECAAFAPGTRENILRQFSAWSGTSLTEPDPAFFGVWYLGAKAGYGKTCLASVISRRFQQDVLAVHFCRFDELARNDPTRIVKSIAWQIAQRIPEYRAELFRILPSVQLAQSQSAMSLPPLELWTMLLADPLKAVSATVEQRRQGRRWVLLIDAMDETFIERGAEAPNVLATLLSAGMQLLPGWVSLALTSAGESPDPVFEPLSPGRVDIGGSAVERQDVITFLKHHLKPAGGPMINLAGESDPAKIEPALDSVIPNLAESCGVSIVAAHFLLKELRVLPSDSSAAPQSLRDFNANPLAFSELTRWRGLIGFYEDFFMRVISASTDSAAERLTSCVRFIVRGSFEPMTLQMIAELLTLSATMPSLTAEWSLTANHVYTFEEVAAMIAPVAPVYVVSQPLSASSTVRLFHASVKRWEETSSTQETQQTDAEVIRACWNLLTGGASADWTPDVNQDKKLRGSPPPLCPQLIKRAEQFHRDGRVASASAEPLSGLSIYAIRWICSYALRATMENGSTSLFALPQLHYLRCLLDADAPRQICEELQIQSQEGVGHLSALSWAPPAETFLVVSLFHRILTPQRQQQWSKQPESLLTFEVSMMQGGCLLTERRSSDRSNTVFHLGGTSAKFDPRVLQPLLLPQSAQCAVESVLMMGLVPRTDVRARLLARLVELLRTPDCRLRVIELRKCQATDAELKPLFEAIAMASPKHPLQQLLLNYNALRNLPQDFQMRGWQGLSVLDLSDNRSLISPAYALVSTSEKALRYFTDLTSETPQRVSKLRLMVTGFGGVGKSTFIQAFSRALHARIALAKGRDKAAAPTSSSSSSASRAAATSCPASPLYGFLSSLERNSAAATREWTTKEVTRWARIRELPLACIDQLSAQGVTGGRLCGWADEANQSDRLAFADSCIGAESEEEKQQSANDEQKQQSSPLSLDGEPTSPAGRPGALSPYKDHTGSLLSWSAVRSSKVAALDRLLLSECVTLVHTTGYCSTSAPVQSSLGDFEVIDFSGQIEYYVSHSLFLSGQHAIFVCVAPAAKQFGSKGMEVNEEGSTKSAAATGDSAALLLNDAVSASALASPDSMRRRDQWQFWLRFLSTLSAAGSRTPVHLAVSRCDFLPRAAVERKLRPLVQKQRDELSSAHSSAANPRLELHSTVHTLDYRDAWIDADINSVCDAVLATAKRMFQDSLIPFVYHKLEVALRAEIERRKAGNAVTDSASASASSPSPAPIRNDAAWRSGLPVLTEQELADFAARVDARYSTDPALLQRCCDHLQGVALLLFVPSLRLYVLEPIRWLAAVLALFIRDGREDTKQLESDQLEFDRLMEAATSAAPSDSPAPSQSPSFLTPYHIVKHQLEGSGLAIGDDQCRWAASILVALDVAHHDARTDQFLFPTQLPPVSKAFLTQKMFHRIHEQKKLQRPPEINPTQWSSFFSPAGSVSRLQSLLEHRRLLMHYAAANTDRIHLANKQYPSLPESFFSHLHDGPLPPSAQFCGVRLSYTDPASFLPPGLFVQLQMRLIQYRFIVNTLVPGLVVGDKPSFRSEREVTNVESYDMRRGASVLRLANEHGLWLGSLMVRLDPRAQCIDIHFSSVYRTDCSPVRDTRELISELCRSFSGFSSDALESTWLCPMCIAACRFNCCQFPIPADQEQPIVTESLIARRTMWPHEATPERMRALAVREAQEQKDNNDPHPRFSCCVDESAPEMRWLDLYYGAAWQHFPVPSELDVPTSTDLTRPAFGRWTSCLPVSAIPTRTVKSADSQVVPGAVASSSTAIVPQPASITARPIDVFIVWSYDESSDYKGSAARERELAAAMRAPFVVMLFTAHLLDSSREGARKHSLEMLRIVKYRAEQAQLQRQRLASGTALASDLRFEFYPCALLPMFLPRESSDTVEFFLSSTNLEFDPASEFIKAICVGGSSAAARAAKAAAAKAASTAASSSSLVPSRPSSSVSLPTVHCKKYCSALVELQLHLVAFLPLPENPAVLTLLSGLHLSPPQLAQYERLFHTDDSNYEMWADESQSAGIIEQNNNKLLRTILQMHRFAHPTAVVLPAPSIKETPKGLIATLSAIADAVSLRSMMCTEVQVRLMCECDADPARWHYADGENVHGGYRVHKPNEFIQRHGKTLKIGLQILAAAARFVPFVGGAVGEAVKGSADTIRTIADDASKVSEGLSNLIGCVDTLMSEAGGSGATGLAQANKDHVALTTFGEWLDAQDRKEGRKVFHCGLQRVVLLRDESYSTLDGEELRERKEGSVVWLCAKHAAEYRDNRWGRLEADEQKTTTVADHSPAAKSEVAPAAPAASSSSSSPPALRNNFVEPPAASTADKPTAVESKSTDAITTAAGSVKKAESGCCTVQ